VLTRLSEFQFLRSLASERPAVGIVTISRKPVYVIEIDAVSGSTLDAVLSLRCDVGCFTDDEVDQMLDKSRSHGVDLAMRRADVVKFTGGHPCTRTSSPCCATRLCSSTGAAAESM
jgi:hypothetical protein